MANQFDLPEADQEYLAATGFDWETVVDGADKWLLIHNYPIPEQYDVSTCTVALRIPPAYPQQQIDMAYFHPELHRADGKTVNGVTSVNIQGRVFQQWSRHRTEASAWRPDIDGVATHLTFMTAWLTEEFRKR